MLQDYAFWSFMLKKMGTIPYSNVSVMKDAANSAWNDLEEGYIRKVCSSFP